jgi:hypothetical protein
MNPEEMVGSYPLAGIFQEIEVVDKFQGFLVFVSLFDFSGQFFILYKGWDQVFSAIEIDHRDHCP